MDIFHQPLGKGFFDSLVIQDNLLRHFIPDLAVLKTIFFIAFMFTMCHAYCKNLILLDPWLQIDKKPERGSLPLFERR